MPVAGIFLVIWGYFLEDPDFWSGGICAESVVEIPGLAVLGLCSRPGRSSALVMPGLVECTNFMCNVCLPEDEESF